MSYAIIDYKEEARGRVTSQFEHKPIFNRYLNLLLSGSMDLQEVFKTLMENRWIDTATGVMLDIIGEIVGQERTIEAAQLKAYFAFIGLPLGLGFGTLEDRTVGGEYRSLFEEESSSYVTLSDSEYRVFILSKIFRNTTSCSPDEFISFFDFVFDIRDVDFIELGNATVEATITAKLTDFEEALVMYTKDNLGNTSFFVPKPAGVRLDLEIINLANAEQLIGVTGFQIMDTHILRDLDDSLGFYVAVMRTTPVWQGATISFSEDGGLSYFKEIDILQEGVFGELTESMDAHPHWYQDKQNTVSLELFNGSDYPIQGNTHAENLNGKGVILVGEELMAYQDVTPTGDYSYSLSKLLRGRKGSTSVPHSSGERVVFLDYGVVPFIKDVELDKGQTYTINIRSKDTTTKLYDQTITYKARSQTELAPASLRVRRDGSDMHLSWVGVGRLEGDIGGSAEMGQYYEEYKVTSGGVDYTTQDMELTIPYSAGLIRVVQTNSITGDGDSVEVVV